MERPWSCDTLVAFPPATANGNVIFGKNSDRPGNEVQEIIYREAKEYSAGEKLMCTYIEIDQAAKTHAVILSKPSWMWGAEMGANDQGVCIGNEAVWTKLNSQDDLTERLLGMDLVRLGLERGSNAKESLDVITSLLSQYGQGGSCLEGKEWAYHNSFLIVDCSEGWVLETAGPYWVAERVTGERFRANGPLVYGQGGSCLEGKEWAYHNSFLIVGCSEGWVLETAGPYWVAERVTEGVRNISNQLTITTKFDLSSPDLVQKAMELGYYKPDDGPFNFAKVFEQDYTDPLLEKGSRLCNGRRLLKEMSKNGQFGVTDMMTILRDEDSGINMGTGTCGSQVSVLPPSTAASSYTPCSHWLTGTPSPAHSLFKPFIFGPGPSIGNLATSPDFGSEDPRIMKPRFQKVVDRRHDLNKGQQKLLDYLDKEDPKGLAIVQNIKELESNCIGDVDELVKNYDESSFHKVKQLFEHMCNIELNFYK